jgi:hypothetical protein
MSMRNSPTHGEQRRSRRQFRGLEPGSSRYRKCIRIEINRVCAHIIQKQLRRLLWACNRWPLWNKKMPKTLASSLVLPRGDGYTVGESCRAFDLAQLLMSIVADCVQRRIEVTYVGPTRCRHVGRILSLQGTIAVLINGMCAYSSSSTIRLTVERERCVIAIGSLTSAGAPHNVYLELPRFLQLIVQPDRSDPSCEIET